MKLTNQTYQVLVSTPKTTEVIFRGSKAEATKVFESNKNNPEYECVMLSKYSKVLNCWYEIEKRI